MNDEDKLLEIIYSYRKAQLIHVAARLKVSDILDNGAKSYNEIAELTKTDPDVLYRILRALSSFGIYKEKENKYFELTEMGELLKEDNNSSIRINALMRMDEYNWKPWGELLYSVKTGKNAFEKIFGKNLFEYLSEHPEKSVEFNEAMKTYTFTHVDSLLDKYDFSQYKLIADIGGSHGLLVRRILAKHKEIKGILFDLPNVIDEVKDEFKNIDILKRCSLIKGSFFESVPGDCDMYIYKKILHDWDDEHSLRILENCYKASKKGSKILIVESVIMNNDENYSNTVINDIHMLVQTIGGCERTGEEYIDLLNKAGFKTTKVTNQYVEAVK